MRPLTRPVFVLSSGTPPAIRDLIGAGAIVLLTGCAAALIGVGTSFVEGNGTVGVVISVLAALLILAFWGVQAWLIDAGAGMLGRAGRRRAMLVASAPAFPTWIVYSLVTLGQAAAARFDGARSALAITLIVVTLPVLFWFLALTVRAVRRVYDVPTINAFGLALLPYAAVAGALVILTAAAGLFGG